jgi:hypothetical protein
MKSACFQNPFAIDIHEVLTQMQMEVIELQSNDSLKDAFSEGNYCNFMLDSLF